MAFYDKVVEENVLKDYFGASTTTTKTYTEEMVGLKIKNDSSTSISLEVGGFTIAILGNETLDLPLTAFLTLKITATTAFRCFVYGFGA